MFSDLPIMAIVGGYINNKGKCSGGGDGGSCPDCVGATGIATVCDSSLVSLQY